MNSFVANLWISSQENMHHTQKYYLSFKNQVGMKLFSLKVYVNDVLSQLLPVVLENQIALSTEKKSLLK